MKHSTAFIGGILILVLATCGPSPKQVLPTTTSPPTQTTLPPTVITPFPTTSAGITVDGQGNDWASYPVNVSDPAGDQLPGSSDLAEVKAVSDTRYLYLMVSLYEQGQTDHYEIVLMSDGIGKFKVWAYPDQYKVQIAPAPFIERETPADAVVVQGEVVEIAIPLSTIQNQAISGFSFRALNQKEEGDRVESAQAALVAAPLAVESPQATLVAAPLDLGQLANSIIIDPSYKADVIYIPNVRPWLVRVGPNDEILIAKHPGNTIYQLNNDGSLSVYASFPNIQFLEFNFDRAGNLWLTGGQELFKVVNSIPHLIARNVFYEIDFDSQGNVYGVHHLNKGLYKITPDGQVKVLAPEIISGSLAITPNDEILVVEGQKLFQVQPDGQQEVVTDLGFETSVEVAPDGSVYVLGSSGLDQVNLQTGVKTHVTWFDSYSTGQKGVFDREGRLLTFHPSYPLERVDLHTKTVEMLYNPHGNTTAMAVSPDGNLFLAYGNGFPDGESILYRAIDKTKLEEIVRVPYGNALSIAFGQDGQGYLGVSDQEKGAEIYTFDAANKSYEKLLVPICWPNSIAIDPTTGNLWWFSCDLVHERDKAGNVRDYPIPTGTANKVMAFTPDGTLYAVFWFGYNTSQTVAKRGIFQRNADGTWTSLIDVTHPDRLINRSMITVCPNGEMYNIQFMRMNEVLGAAYNAGMALTVFTVDRTTGLRTPIGTNFSADPFAVVCTLQNHVVFTTADGVVELYHR